MLIRALSSDRVVRFCRLAAGQQIPDRWSDKTERVLTEKTSDYV